MNMAIDEALMKLNSEPVLRFYRWRPAAVSIGYSQDLKKEIDLKQCKRYNIDHVRRPTGGRAVLHDDELTYSFVCPKDFLPEEIIESYKVISSGIITALKKLGLKAEMKQGSDIEKSKTPVCFDAPSWYEITVNGKKIVGSAQTRKQDKILQHGSVLMGFEHNLNVGIFNIPDNKRPEMLKRLHEGVTYLNAELKLSSESEKGLEKSKTSQRKKVTYEDVARAMHAGFEKNFNAKFALSRLTNEELRLAEQLDEEKYSTAQWNEKRLSFS